ncbi:MAG: hypothetical protein ACR2P5_04535 [Gammaproteobacteria bacterium]
MTGFGGRAFGEPPQTAERRPPPLAPHKFFLFALVAALWIGAGLFGRDPWKPQETEFTVLIAAQTGAISPPETALPLRPPSIYLTLAEWSARIFAPLLPLHEGARMINALLFAAGFLFIGLAAGGGARRGWMAVFLTMGMAGLAVRAHLLNLAAPAFFGAAALLLGAQLLRRNALGGGVLAGGSAAFLFAAASPSVAVFAAGGVLLVLGRAEWRRPSVYAGLAAAAVFFAPLALLSPFAKQAAESLIPKTDWTVAADLARLAAWSLFPALPIAAVALWKRGAADAELFLCLAMAGAGAAHFAAFGGREEDLFWLMPPLAVFAARGLEKLPDDYAAILDWFAVIVAGACCVGGLWAAWFLAQSGAEWESLAQWRERFPLLKTPHTAGWKIAAAGLITALWAGLAANMGRSNERAVLNWSAGVTVIWCVFNLLWVPAVDSGKSYRPMAAAVISHSGEECVQAGAGTAEAAGQLYYFGAKSGENCKWIFQNAEQDAPADSRQIWQGGRYDRKNYILYKRINGGE